MTIFVWIGIGLCLCHSGMFSGMNLALFTVSRLRLEIEASRGGWGAQRVLALRKDYNFALTTILWGNVGANVLLALLSNSVLAGVLAFLFSTVIITFFGEIFPQAYFSRHALKMASLLSPVLRFYQLVLYPLAKPSALLLDRLLGREGIRFFAERDLRELIKMHMADDDADIDHVEGRGALNFLDIDDIMAIQEGEPIDPESILSLNFVAGKPVFPKFEKSPEDPFLRRIYRPDRKWIILTDENGVPRLVLDSNAFLRAALFEEGSIDPLTYCHKPIITDIISPLGESIQRLKVEPERPGDDVIDKDVVLVWRGPIRRIITGADVLGRLLRGIVDQEVQVRPKKTSSGKDKSSRDGTNE